MKFLIKQTPDNFIKAVNDEISSILNRNLDGFFPEFMSQDDTADKLVMPVELHEHKDDYTISAELPGIKKEDLDIDIDKNYITINAKKEEETEKDEHHYKKSEFRYGEFSRTVTFPQEIDVDKTNAKLENGILKIKAPKKQPEKEKVKKLTVQ